MKKHVVMLSIIPIKPAADKRLLMQVSGMKQKVWHTKFIKDFDSDDYIVAPSASCVGFVRNYYAQLFENSSQHNLVKNLTGRIFEFTEFLMKVLKIENYGAQLNVKATYHDSCAALA